MKTAMMQLIDDLKNSCDFSIFNDHHINHYLDIEKQQIIDAVDYGSNHYMDGDNYFINTYSEQYETIQK